MNSKIRNLIVRLGFMFLPILVLCSCEDEPEPQQYDVRIVVETDSWSSQVYIYGALERDLCLPMCRHLDRVFTRTRNDAYLYKFDAYCEDPETLIKIKVWVNDEFSGEVEGHSRVYIWRLIDNPEVFTDFYRSQNSKQ